MFLRNWLTQKTNLLDGIADRIADPMTHFAERRELLPHFSLYVKDAFTSQRDKKKDFPDLKHTLSVFNDIAKDTKEAPELRLSAVQNGIIPSLRYYSHFFQTVKSAAKASSAETSQLVQVFGKAFQGNIGDSNLVLTNLLDIVEDEKTPPDLKENFRSSAKIIYCLLSHIGDYKPSAELTTRYPELTSLAPEI